jgi:hypothetical protein
MNRSIMLGTALALVAALATVTLKAQSAATRLDDADQHLAKALELLQAAEAPRTNRAAHERYVQNAIAMCREARQQIRLARQAPFIPPGYVPAP